MQLILYLEIDLICMFMAAVILRNMKKSGSNMPDDRLFCWMQRCVIIILISDCISKIVDGRNSEIFSLLNGASVLVYFVLTGVISFTWVLYTDYKINEDYEGLKRRTKIYMIPCIFLGVASLLSPWTGWIFYIAEGNFYTRGKLIWLQMAIAWIYSFYSAFYALWMSRRKVAKKEECMWIFRFISLPMIGSVVQMFFYGLPTLWVSVTCSLLVYINIQNDQISLDALTGVNNRGQFNRYLESKLTNLNRETRLTLIIIDVDKFKNINDTYGHHVGDMAIIKVANMLKKACGRYKGNSFLARFGGDEFVVVCIEKRSEEANGMIDIIHKVEKETQENNKDVYTISLSCGAAVYGEDGVDTMDQLISKADQNMYNVKNSKKKIENIVKQGDNYETGI